jgi:hypothetical protein
LSRPLHTEVGSNRVGALRDRVNFRRHFCSLGIGLLVGEPGVVSNE